MLAIVFQNDEVLLAVDRSCRPPPSPPNPCEAAAWQERSLPDGSSKRGRSFRRKVEVEKGARESEVVDRLVARHAGALGSLSLRASGEEEADRGDDELRHAETVT